MAVHKMKKGLDLPINGAPEQSIQDSKTPTRIALLADDYIGMKPTMLVQPGDTVKRGQPVFEDKKSPGILYTAPGAGTVLAIHRGDKRALQSVTIELSDGERSGAISADEQVSFAAYTGKDIAGLNRDDVRSLLIESGLWTGFRTRPYGKVPSVDTDPDAIFINGMDSNPLTADVDVVVGENKDAFERGIAAIAKLRERHIYLCVKDGSDISAGPYSGVQVESFSGPHPSGTVGVHIHTLLPVHRERVAWHIGYQDVIAIGKLFTTGMLDTSRVVALAGPQVTKPRLIRTRIGASLDELTAGELTEDENRIISGSAFSGRKAQGENVGYLGRYANQVTVLHEDRERVFMGWLGPGQEKFSIINTFVSKLKRDKKFDFTTSKNGSERAMVPIGMYEDVMPMDFMMTHLLRAIVMGDVERAEELGCLELDEEDLALSCFVCPGKYEYGPYLRQILTQIEHEG
jgi:Na+-transporting NADH:ubiquinone oxidoreductase subunit A